MGEIIITKKVSLEFLGEEFKESYLVFKSISIQDYDKMGDQTVKDCVAQHFIEGQIAQGSEMVAVTKDNLFQLPGEVFVNSFEEIMGRMDPKAPAQ